MGGVRLPRGGGGIGVEAGVDLREIEGVSSLVQGEGM